MKARILSLIATLAATSPCLAQLGSWEDVGLIPRTATFDVPYTTNYTDLETESMGIGITANNNVLIGWEHDFGAATNTWWEAIKDTENIWSLFDADGNLLTPSVTLTDYTGTNTVPNATYRGSFRDDGTPSPGNEWWGPKVHANLFGNGIGVGGNATLGGVNPPPGFNYGMAFEVPRLLPIAQDDTGYPDFPAVQLLNNNGTKAQNVLSGVSDANAQPAGRIRIGDWEYLANGNIVVVGESQQVPDRALTGQSGNSVIVYRIVTPTGVEIHPYAAVSSSSVNASIWGGVGVTANGFAVRFDAGGVQVRMFDNSGNPTTPNISLGTLTGVPHSGRGDAAGFHGNGADAYLDMTTCNAGNGNTAYITVLNANGTLRYAREVGTNLLGSTPIADRVDGAISADGRVIAVFDDAVGIGSSVRLPQARLFDPCGNPMGDIFWFSERDNATNAFAECRRPRAAWRGNQIAICWESLNNPNTVGRVASGRIFDVGPNLNPAIPCGAEAIGLTRIVPDTLVWFSTSQGISKIGGYVAGDQAVMGTSVEATAGVLGDSTFLLAATTQATNDPPNMSFTSVLIPAVGGAPKLDNLWYTDAGTPWLKQINLSRQTGNPGRIGGDPRYGAVNYGGAGEVSLFAYPEFNSDGRWSNPFFTFLGTVGTPPGPVGGRSYGVQLHRLNPLTLASTPTSKAVDSMYGRLWTNAVQLNAGQQDVGRTGSSPIGLDNGNFVFVGEDRSGLNNPGGPNSGRAAIMTIFAPNGSIVKEASPVYTVATGPGGGSMWNSVGAYRGGFFVRPEGGVIYFYDNAGNLQGTNNHNETSGLLYATDRSDGTRMCSDIRSHYVFQAGKAPESASFTNIMLTAYDANTRTWIANTIVSDDGNQELLNTGGTRLLDRANIACDQYNRVTVAYRIRPDRSVWLNDQIAARVYAFDGTKFTPLTPTFFPFIQHDADPNNLAGFKSMEPSVAMTPREILFYAKGFWNATASPTDPAVTLDNTHCYTILSHPAPLAATRPMMTISQSAGHAIISWPADAGLFTVQKTTSLSPASWSDVTAGNVATPVDAGVIGATPTYYQLVRKF